MPEKSGDTSSGNGPEAQTGPRVNWDDRNLKSSYANVCNVSSTREEVVLLFGVNQSWQGATNEVTVQLTDRLILSPFAAKRLSILLDNVMQQYEQRFGSLEVQAPQTRTGSEPKSTQ
jgi:hypothetical protein